MNEKERLLGVLRGEAIPEAPCICPGGMMNAVVVGLMDRCGIAWPEAHTDPVKMADLARAVYDHKMFENYGVPFCMTVEAEAMGAPVDMGDRECEPHVSGYVIDGVERWAELPDPVQSVSRGRARVEIDHRLMDGFAGVVLQRLVAEGTVIGAPATAGGALFAASLTVGNDHRQAESHQGADISRQSSITTGNEDHFIFSGQMGHHLFNA